MLARAHKKFQRGQQSEIYLLTLKEQDKTKMELPHDMVSAEHAFRYPYLPDYRCHMYDESRMASSTGPFKWTFLKIDHYCGGFERKMKRVGSILTKLSFDKDFKVWTGFVGLRRLLGF